jgi:hypothetical protein
MIAIGWSQVRIDRAMAEHTAIQKVLQSTEHPGRFSFVSPQSLYFLVLQSAPLYTGSDLREKGVTGRPGASTIQKWN